MADVVILDPIAVVRERMVAELLAAGHAVAAPLDIATYQRVNEQPVAVVVRLTTRPDLEQVRRIRSIWPDAIIVGLAGMGTPEGCASALAAGANSVLGPDAAASDVVTAIDYARRAHTVLPHAAAAALAAHTARTGRGVAVTDQQRVWLQRFLDGATIETLADEAGYSRRHFNRLLNTLYSQLDARDLRQALVIAATTGLIACDATAR